MILSNSLKNIAKPYNKYSRYYKGQMKQAERNSIHLYIAGMNNFMPAVQITSFMMNYFYSDLPKMAQTFFNVANHSYKKTK